MVSKRPAPEEPRPVDIEEPPPDEVPVRPLWSGTISFGLVSVPVNMYPGNRAAGLALRMLDEDGTPLKRRFFCPREKREVHPEHIIRGYELESGEYVVVHDEELEALEPRKSRDIDLRLFVDAGDIDAVYFERAYFLAPASDSNKAYRLLATTMERLGQAGIATFVMRGTEYLVAIFAEGGILRAETLRFQDELRSPEDIGLPSNVHAGRAELARFERELGKLARDRFDPAELKDEYAERFRKLIERKRREKRDVVEVPQGAEPAAREPDLLEIIRRSLRGAARGARSRGNGRRAKTLRERRAGRSDGRRHTRSGLAARSRQQLYERARQLGVEGRSRMDKQELERAIRQREH
jgi:DNA end-binding protein Ku